MAAFKKLLVDLVVLNDPKDEFVDRDLPPWLEPFDVLEACDPLEALESLDGERCLFLSLPLPSVFGVDVP